MCLGLGNGGATESAIAGKTDDADGAENAQAATVETERPRAESPCYTGGEWFRQRLLLDNILLKVYFYGVDG